MQFTTTRGFRHISQLILLTFCFSLLHPASLRTPWSFDLQVRVSGSGGLAIISSLFSFELGPQPVYGQDALLAPTPEVDITHPDIVKVVNDHSGDPEQLFQHVRTFDYNAYTGSLRGSLGTLWSKAGNALDKASLLIALFRAAGLPARYVQSALTTAQAQELLLSMFPQRLNIVGCLSDGAILADPLNDAQLISDAQDHYYVEVDLGNGFTPADPTLGVTLGDAVAPNQGTSTEASDSLRHKVTVRLQAELINSFPGSPPEMSTPLNETFLTVELVGKSVVVGHFVKSDSLPSLVFGATTNTYTPYILIGQNDPSISDDPIIRGTDYQEYLTSFPLGSSILTGVFLEIDVVSPTGTTETFERTLLDRIGFAARHSGGTSGIASPGDEPALSDLDLVVINVLPGLQSPDAIVRQQDRLAPVKAELDVLQPLIDAIPDSGPLTSEEEALLGTGVERMREAAIVGAEAIAMTYAIASDTALGQLERGYLTKAYYASPRLILVLAERNANSFTLKLDIRKNDVKVSPHPGQVVSIGPFFEMARGLVESALEGIVLSTLLGELDSSSFAVFSNLPQSASIELISQDNLSQLGGLNISDEAKARISQATTKGKIVLTPDQAVLVNGTETIGWLEIDQTTGHTIAVMEDGGHQALVDYTLLTTKQRFVDGNALGIFVGTLQGYSVGILTFLAAFIDGLTDNIQDPVLDVMKAAKQRLELEVSVMIVKLLIGEISPDLALGIKVADCIFKTNLDTGRFEFKPSLIVKCVGSEIIGNFVTKVFADGLKVGTIAGMLLALGWIDRNLPVDPPVFPFLSSDLAPRPEAIPPGGLPGVNVNIVPDDLFTLLVGDTELASVFQAHIQNTGPTEETFEITFPAVPDGWTARSSVSAMSIPPGETGVVGICLTPDALDAPGTLAPFTVEVAGANDPSVTEMATEAFSIPEVQGISLEVNPDVVNTTPGSSVPATLTVTNIGNVGLNNIALDLQVSTGLTVSGLSSVTLGVGESITQNLTLNVGGSAPLNEILAATFTPTAGLSPKSVTIAVQVVDSAAQSAADAALAASDAGRPELGGTLRELSAAMTALAENLDDPVLQSRVCALVASVLEQFNAAAFDPFVAALTTAKTAVCSAATSGEIQTALNDISGILTSVGDALQTADAFPFEISLTPNSAVALPNTPTNFDISLTNTGTQIITYNLSLGTLPPGITGSLDNTSVTLGPGEFIPAIQTGSATVTITQPVQELTAFEFVVTASVAPGVAKAAIGTFTARDEEIDVTRVDVEPSFGDPGDSVDVSARIFNAVNQTRNFKVFYEVLDPASATIFTSTPQQVELTVSSSLDEVDLGALDTTGFALGTHTIKVTVTELDDTPVPGAMAQAPLLIGSPVVATLSVDQEEVPPCDTTVPTALDIQTTIALPPADIDILDIVDTAGSATSVVVDKDEGLAYVCGTEDVTVMDVSDPEDVQVVTTFATGISGFWGTCALNGDQLIVTHPVGLTTKIQVYSLVDPRAPVFIGSNTIPGIFLTGMFVDNDAAFVSTQGIATIGRTPRDLFGDLTSFDLTTDLTTIPATIPPTRADTIGPGGFVQQGGTTPVMQGAPIGNNIGLVPTSTSDGTPGFNNFRGIGCLWIVDYSDPFDMTVLPLDSDPSPTPEHPGTQCGLFFPETGHLMGVAVQGETALVVGSSGIRRTNGSFIGTLVLITLDISDPTMPEVRQSLTTTLPAPGILVHPAAIGDNLFALSGGTVADGAGGTTPTILLVDASDPANMKTTQVKVPTGVNDLSSMDGTLYATSSAGLTILDLGSISSGNVAVEVQIPSGVSIVPNSFNIEPDQTVPGAGFDTFSWTGLGADTVLTWETAITDLRQGEVREIVQHVMIDFTLPTGDTGQLELPPLMVVGQQILLLAPNSQTVQPGEPATYTVTLKNPLANEVAFDVAVQGVSQDWVDVAPSVTVPADSVADVTLTLQSDPLAATSEYGFIVSAADTCAAGSVHGSFILEGDPFGGTPTPPDPGQDIESEAHGCVLDLTPTQATGGQGTPAEFTVRVTNTGNVADIITLSVSLPNGFSGGLAQTVVDLLPGLDNFRDIPLTLTPPTVGSGIQAFTVTAANGSLCDQVNGSVDVVQQGVDVALSPSTGLPGGVFELKVTNTGQGPDTFNVFVAGPLAPFVALSDAVVSLGKGEMAIVTVTVDAIDFAFPGSLFLIGVATSQTNMAVTDADTAAITIVATSGLDIEFQPASIDINQPGAEALLLLLHNLGNQEDAYTATITGVTGPLTASLTGLDRLPTQTIPLLRLPGTSTGALLLTVDLTETGQGSVEVAVTSLTDPNQTDTAMALINATAQALDHFQCYRTRPTRGSICADDAPANSGGTCEDEVDCGGQDGGDNETDFCIPNRFPRGLEVSLLDQFEDKDFRVPRSRGLCTPADKNEEGIVDFDTHLQSYTIKEVRKSCRADAFANPLGACRVEEDCGGDSTGTLLTEFCQKTPKHVKQKNVRIDNQFGTLFVETKRPDRLYVPTAKDPVNPIGPPDSALHNVDHFKCYIVQAKRRVCEDDPQVRCRTDQNCVDAGLSGACNQGFPRDLQVTIADQFTDPENLYDVQRPTRLCTPVDKNSEGIKNPEEHLMCYTVKPVRRICADDAPLNGGGECRNEQHCGGTKKVTAFCLKQLRREKVLGVHVSNQFGADLLDVIVEQELCVPSMKTLTE